MHVHRRDWSSLLATLLVLAAGPWTALAQNQGESTKTKPAWKTLFDGKSMDGWKSAEYIGGGKVHLKDGAIVMEKGERMTGATYKGKDFPKMDYEVAFEGKKVSGDDFFCTTTFPVAD